MSEISIIIVILICPNLGMVLSVKQKNKLPSPMDRYTIKFTEKIFGRTFFHRISSKEKSCCYVFPKE